jgi:hypothetical protein
VGRLEVLVARALGEQPAELVVAHAAQPARGPDAELLVCAGDALGDGAVDAGAASRAVAAAWLDGAARCQGPERGEDALGAVADRGGGQPGRVAVPNWVEVDVGRRLREGMFVAQVVGRSMEPAVPDGAYCLFRWGVAGTREGRTVLVRLRDVMDPESGESFTLKRYTSTKVAAEDGGWRHLLIQLRPANPEFEPIELTVDDEGGVDVVAELLEVLS